MERCMVQPILDISPNKILWFNLFIFQFWSEPTSERNSWGQLPGLLLRHVLTEAKDLHASFRCLGRQMVKMGGVKGSILDACNFLCSLAHASAWVHHHAANLVAKIGSTDAKYHHFWWWLTLVVHCCRML